MATGAARTFISHDDIARRRENCGWVSLVLAFWGGRVIMREGMNVRGFEHCGNAMVFGGHRRVMRLRAVQNALAATIIILCANILCVKRRGV